MAYDPINLPITDKSEVLPQELSNQYYKNLDEALARAEAKQMERTLGDLSNRGFFRSGQTFENVATDVLGPSQERRANLIMPEIQRGAMLGREERMGSEAFQRQKEMAAIEQQYKLEQMQKQAQIQEMLLRLQDELNGPSGDPWMELAGMAAGGIAGSFAGPAGSMIGSKLGGSLFKKKQQSGASGMVA